jgi:hypothetical protein
MKLTEKQSKARAALFATFQGKVCPILSVAGLKPPEPSRLASLGGPPPEPKGEAIACQGPVCQWFVITGGDAEGNAIAGGCVVALLPSAILQLKKEPNHD